MSSDDDHIFLFASLNSKQPLTARKVHIRRLYDILQLTLHKYDFQRAKQVWAILARCKEVDWKALWSTGLHILGEDANLRSGQVSIEYLRSMMLQCPDDRETILKELVFRLLLVGQCREALDELELYLPSFPYQDNPILHIYAGLSAMYLAQSHSESSHSFDRILLHQAQTHLEHAKIQDPDNAFADAFIEKISALQNIHRKIQDDSDDESMNMDDIQPDRKRTRT